VPAPSRGQPIRVKPARPPLPGTVGCSGDGGSGPAARRSGQGCSDGPTQVTSAAVGPADDVLAWELAADGVSILLSSHQIEEVEGVGVVTIEAPPKVEKPSVQAQPVAVKLLVDSGKVVLTGTVPAEDVHGALLDAEILAEVYIELTGGRQAQLGLQGTGHGAGDTQGRAAVILVRPLPLAPRVTAAERGSAALARASDPQRFHAAVRQAGGGCGELLWQFPIPQHLAHADKKDILKFWNELHAGNAERPAETRVRERPGGNYYRVVDRTLLVVRLFNGSQRR